MLARWPGGVGFEVEREWRAYEAYAWRRSASSRGRLSEPDVSRWIAESRLNLLQALPDHLGEPAVQAALERFVSNVGPAIERLRALDALEAA